jgi:maltose alpha-D-glucosyltransferase/alpha-amylase
MPHTKLHYRFGGLALITVICTAISGLQTSFAQDSPVYIQFLQQNSMLYQGQQEASTISGQGVQWRHHYESPEPSQLLQKASTWLLYYPASVITKPNTDVIATWGDSATWEALQSVGIELQHTDPIERAGGISGTTFTPTIDGWFDRIALDLDPTFGTEDEFKQFVQTASQHNATVGGDLVPLHTGLGADFKLAERAYQDYPGMYDMVEIPQELWNLLPAVSDPDGTALVSVPVARQLTTMGYIPGTIHSADADPEANTWSGWSATPEIVGVDGKSRRWVYLHIFKPAQPTTNWLDPSLAAQRANYGDIARNIVGRGNILLRLDAAPFTAIDPDTSDSMAQDYLLPLSVDNTNDLAFLARKLGGWTYQELYTPLEQVKQYTQYGPDISYDFFTRAQVLVPLITQDATYLRLAQSMLLQVGVSPGTLVHDLQNHDEITFQLIDVQSRQTMQLDGQTYSGQQVYNDILNAMRSTVGAQPYNKLYRPAQDGIATTYAGFIAPAIGITDPYHATADQVAQIQKAHILVAIANAMEPGAFGISAWDLVGALPIPAESVPGNLTAGGDWRWINRGAVDLMNNNPSATTSAVLQIPKAQTLYGDLPTQLTNPNSFAGQIKQILAARKHYNIAGATMNAIPPTGNKAVAVYAMTLPSGDLAITALNYGRSFNSVQVDLTQIPPGIPASQVAGESALEIITNQTVGVVNNAGTLTVNLDALAGQTIVVHRQGATPTPSPAPPPTPAPPPVGSVRRTISMQR